MAFLLDRLREAGADDQAAALASRAAALDHPGGGARLLRSLREAGAREQAATLAADCRRSRPVSRLSQHPAPA